MLFSTKQSFVHFTDRQRFAASLAGMFSNSKTFEPYNPDSDTYFWALDEGNDWKLKFFPERPNEFAITYRYQCETNQHEEALAEWLKIRMNVTVLESSRINLNNIRARVIRLLKFQHPMLWCEGLVPIDFSLSFGAVREDSNRIIKIKNESVAYNSTEFLAAEAALVLFFPTIPGYRIVEIEEYAQVEALPKNDETIEVFDGGIWSPVTTLHLDYTQIYQTKRIPTE